MTIRMTMMAAVAMVAMAGGALAAGPYFADMKKGGDMDEYAFNVVKAPSVKKALTGLLGAANYKALAGRMETTGKMEQNGDHLCGSGLKAHSGGEEEGIFCLNTATGEVQAGIMRSSQVKLYAGEKGPYPELIAWAQRYKK